MESAIMSEAQETVTITNSGGKINDRLSRNIEAGESQPQPALHSAGSRVFQKHCGEGFANSKGQGGAVASGRRCDQPGSGGIAVSGEIPERKQVCGAGLSVHPPGAGKAWGDHGAAVGGILPEVP